MSVADNIAKTKQAYTAFAAADIEAASADIDEQIEWIVPGNSTVSGTYNGKDEVIGLWIALAGKGFSTEPHHFLGEDDTVVVLTTNTSDGESTEAADVLTFKDGKLVKFLSIVDTATQERIYGTK